MADVKISALTAASSLVGTEEFPVVQSGVTKRATGNMLLALANAYADSVVAATDFTGLDDVPSDYTGDALKVVRVNATEDGLEFAVPAAGVTDFTDLADVPSDYTGDALKLVRVNAGGTALEFFAASFDADAIAFDPTGLTQTSATDVQEAIADLDAAIATGAGAASGTTFTPAGTIAATNVQDALEELDAETQAAITALGASTDVGIGTYLVSGAAIAWQTGLSYLVGAASYFIDGVAVSSAAQTVTLTAADGTNDRIDVLVLDASGVLDSIDGTPSADPAEPSIDPALYLRLGIVLVGAGTTAPTITQTNIYLENAEWTASASTGTIVANSTTAPRTGTYSVDGTAVAANTYVSFVKPAAGTTDLATQNSLTFYVRVKAAFPSTKAFRVAWYSGTALRGTQVTVSNGLFGFNSATTGSYQLITIPISAFAMPVGNLVTTLRITVIGGGANVGFYIDDIVLNSGATTIPSLTASRALVSNVSGNVAASAVTSTELGYLAGVTSALQTQINAKASAFTGLSDVPSAYTGHTLKVVRVNAGETALEFATASGGSPGGSNTYIQYNNSGAFGGDSSFTWNSGSKLFTIGGDADVRFGSYSRFLVNDSIPNLQFLMWGANHWTSNGATNTFTFGVPPYMPAADGTKASLRVPHGTAPASPTNGDLWSTTAGFYGRVNGSTVGPFGAATPAASNITWDSTDKGASLTLSGDDLVATSSNYGRVRATEGHSTAGAYQFEVLFTAGVSQAGCGIIRETPAGGWDAHPGYQGDAVAYFQWGDKYVGGSGSAYGASFGAHTIGVVVDFDAGNITFYKNGVSQGVATTGLTGEWFPQWGTNSGVQVGTLNVGDTDFAYPISGALPWNAPAWAGALGSGGGGIATDTIFNAKGDLVVGTGSDTAARLPVGTNGQYLAADSAEATGTKWVTAGDLIEVWQFAVGDETTAITTGTAKWTFRAPKAITLTGVRASLTTVSSSGIPTVDINVNGTTILSTKLTIDASEKTSVTAATAAVISAAAIADDDEITIDIDVAGTGAAGLKVVLIGTANDAKEVIQIALSDETNSITTGTAKVTMRVARAMTITAIRANLNTVSSSGIPTVDINKNGSTILSTKLTIDASEKTSVTAATAYVLSDTALASDDELTFDIDVAGTGAKGLKVTIIGTPT